MDFQLVVHDYELQYKKGSDNKVLDAISRLPASDAILKAISTLICFKGYKIVAIGSKILNLT